MGRLRFGQQSRLRTCSRSHPPKRCPISSPPAAPSETHPSQWGPNLARRARERGESSTSCAISCLLNARLEAQLPSGKCEPGVSDREPSVSYPASRRVLGFLLTACSRVRFCWKAWMLRASADSNQVQSPSRLENRKPEGLHGPAPCRAAALTVRYPAVGVRKAPACGRSSFDWPDAKSDADREKGEKCERSAPRGIAKAPAEETATR